MHTIIVKEKDRHLTVVLNRPEKRNAMNDIMVQELITVFERLPERDDIRTVSLEAEGKAFCSGADLAYLKHISAFDYDQNLQDSRRMARMFQLIYTCPKPVIAVVNGPALAGGCGLATACDFVVAKPEAVFGYPEVRIGFVPALVSTFLVRQTGERAALELMLSGRIITAGEALNLGMINKVTETPPAVRDEWIEMLHKNGPQAMAATKKMLHEFDYSTINIDIERLSIVNAKFREKKEFSQGINSFLNKTRPDWLTS